MMYPLVSSNTVSLNISELNGGVDGKTNYTGRFFVAEILEFNQQMLEDHGFTMGLAIGYIYGYVQPS